MSTCINNGQDINLIAWKISSNNNKKLISFTQKSIEPNNVKIIMDKACTRWYINTFWISCWTSAMWYAKNELYCVYAKKIENRNGGILLCYVIYENSLKEKKILYNAQLIKKH